MVYYYKTKEADKLVINYYNKNGWEKVGAYVFTLGDDDKRNVISAKSPGTEMKKAVKMVGILSLLMRVRHIVFSRI